MENKNLKDLREERKQWFCQMEQKLKETQPKEEDSLFYYHSSEDRIVLSHAMFWTMTQLQFFKSKLRKEKFFLLLRQYQEEMLSRIALMANSIHDASFSAQRIKDDIFQRVLDQRERCFEKLKRDILK